MLQPKTHAVDADRLGVASISLPENIKTGILQLGIRHQRTKPQFQEALARLLEDCKVEHEEFADLYRNALCTDGALVVDNLPCDPDLPPTPAEKSTGQSPKSTFVSEFCLVYLSHVVGHIITYADEGGGEEIYNVHPTKADADKASSTGASKELRFHTEVAFDRNRPDFLILTALRIPSGPQVPTRVAPVASALRTLPSKVIAALEKDVYFIRPPYSFSTSGEVYYRRRLIEQQPDSSTKYTFNFNGGVIFAGDTESSDAVAHACEAFEAAQREVYLRPGEALVIDNNICLHARPSFQPRFDGCDRWLQRVYVRKGPVV